jgi:stage V sporulation protein D (sporulation-specific penicillin-binding protein)
MGGVIAAPVAGELIEDILDYLEVERRYTEQDKQMIVQEVYVPEVRGKSIEEAVKRLREFGLEYKIEGDADNKSAVVLEQTPKPDASIPQKSVVILYTYKPEEEITVKMPDVLNKTISEATQALANVGLNIKVEGMGNAWRQEFQPGTVLEKGKVVEVEFRYLDNVE